MKFKRMPEWFKIEALTAALYSRAAYHKIATLDNKYLIEDVETDTQAYAFVNNRVLYIVFRGTENKRRDILTDASFIRKEIPYNNNKGLKVSGGFLRAYMSIRQEIQDKVISLVNDVDATVICGHSLGGDLATLCAVDLQKNRIVDNRDLRVHTFGQAKFCNRKFKKSYNQRIKYHFRYVNLLDIVPMIPFWDCNVGERVVLAPNIGHDINNYIDNVRRSV